MRLNILSAVSFACLAFNLSLITCAQTDVPMGHRTDLIVNVVAAAETSEKKPKQIELWKENIPGLKKGEKAEIVSAQDERIGERVTKVTKPMISIYSPKPEINTGAAVVICPGGGYHILAYDLEGTEVASWLNKIGVTGIVLHYRVPRSKDRPKHELPLADLQRALSTVRAQADELGIDPEKIGVLGFSAGGHLAAMGSTRHAERQYKPVDQIDKTSCRPDFTVLVYPAYLNKKDSVEVSDEIKIDSNTPPAILIHTGDDRVSSLGSVAYYARLKTVGVTAALHVFPKGGHGYGLRPSENPVSQWPQLVGGWLKSNGFLKAK